MTSARFTTDGGAALLIEGQGARPVAITLEGPRAQVTATIVGAPPVAVSTPGDDMGWSAHLLLAASRWGGPVLPLPSGDYVLRVHGADVDAAHGAGLDLNDLPLTVLATLRAQLHGSAAAGAPSLTIGPPVDPAYDSGEGQDALERRYVAHTAAPENAVFFESFYGRNASCNPLAIDRELARQAPGVTRYWGVVDLSVEVPEGAIPVVEGSPEWWRARGGSRLLVVNDWLRRRYSRRPGQRVLQTWHGTPFKRLALHRPGFDPRRVVAVLKESRRWDVLLAQNAYAARILKKAYAFVRRPLWVEGYPRNDVLVTGDGTATRAVLGIKDSERVILYAPTWRDDREQIVDYLDPVALAEDTGAIILVRGHSRTLLQGRDVTGSRVIDVTTFPDISRLLLIADALVTDYSSVMFDFTVTGRPMYYLVPDIEHYRGELRGVYFDLAEHAPGPLVQTQAQLVEALADATMPAKYAQKYAAWQAKFNARDDGYASERVVARLLDQGFVERA